MNINFEHPKPWNIPRELERAFRKCDLERTLNLLNPIGGGNLYFADYYSKRFIADSSPSSPFALCGYPKELVEAEGLLFYKRILEPSVFSWLLKMNAEALKTYYSYPENERRNLALFFTLPAKNIDGKRIVLQHKYFPYRLDKNGNLWLSLCLVSSSFLNATATANVVDIMNHEKYDYINDAFQLTKTEMITGEDKKILEWMINDRSSEEICDLLKISDSSFKRKRRKLFEKLGVQTAAGAVHRAHLIGLI